MLADNTDGQVDDTDRWVASESLRGLVSGSRMQATQSSPSRIARDSSEFLEVGIFRVPHVVAARPWASGAVHRRRCQRSLSTPGGSYCAWRTVLADSLPGVACTGRALQVLAWDPPLKGNHRLAPVRTWNIVPKACVCVGTMTPSRPNSRSFQRTVGNAFLFKQDVPFEFQAKSFV